jgi:hypothetical protein
VRRTTQKEIDAIVRLDGPARFRHFVKRAVDAQTVWGLWRDGWALMKSDDGRQIFPLWPAREYADLCRVDEWSDYEVEEIGLQDLLAKLLPKLGENGILPGVFPTVGGKGVTLPIDELIHALREEAEKYK